MLVQERPVGRIFRLTEARIAQGLEKRLEFALVQFRNLHAAEHTAKGRAVIAVVE
jgi:hypothetical protein